jgi:phage shock protein PspC (stress-responsive transcriptional regulator)
MNSTHDASEPGAEENPQPADVPPAPPHIENPEGGNANTGYAGRAYTGPNSYTYWPQDPGHHGPRPGGSARFYGWIRSLGVQRGSSRWMGGVCSGLAEKWGIDPVIVRGLAIVLTLFFGIGLLAYGVAWALLPEPDGRIHVEEVARGRWTGGMTGASILTFLGLIGPGQGLVFGNHGGWAPWPLFWIAAVVCCIVWAVNRDKNKHRQVPTGAASAPAQPGQPQAAPRTTPNTAPPAAPGPFPMGPTSGPTQSFSTGAPAAGAWSGHPAAKTAPYNYSRPPRPAVSYRPKPRLGVGAGLLCLGLAILAGALVLILNTAGLLALGGYQVATAAAVAGIVAGLSIMVAGFLGRTAGGLGTFAVLALVAAGLLSIVPQNGSWSLAQSQTWTPTSITAAQNGYSVVLGNGTIDLTQVDGGGALGRDVTVPISVAAAKVTIEVPSNIPVTLKSDLAAAAVSVDGQQLTSAASVVDGTSTDINPGTTGHALVLELDGAAGSVDIVRAGSN